jgi:hypothetical protein
MTGLLGTGPQSNAAPRGPGQELGAMSSAARRSTTHSRPAAYRLRVLVVIAAIAGGLRCW